MRPRRTLSSASARAWSPGFVGHRGDDRRRARSRPSLARPRGRARRPPARRPRCSGIAEFEDDLARARFNDLSHWGYGTGWGVVRGLLGADRAARRRATAAHGAAVWGSAAVTLPALDVAPPSSSGAPRRSRSTLFHHAVYAIATGIAYEALTSGRTRTAAAA